MSTDTPGEIEAIRRRADRNAHAHISFALRLQALDDIATFIAAIGGASIVAAGAILIGSEHPNRGVEISVAVAGGLITLVGVWQAVWRPGERSRQHKDWSAYFTEVEDSCRLVQCGQSDRLALSLMKDLRDVSSRADLIPERHWRRRRLSPVRQERGN